MSVENEQTGIERQTEGPSRPKGAQSDELKKVGNDSKILVKGV